MRFIVPFPPGGGADLISRTVAQGMEKAFKQPVVVENKAGAAGIVGTDALAKSPPDGYTVGLLLSAHAVNDSLYAKLPYKTVEDFAPIGVMANGTYILLVHPSVPANNLAELIALAKAKPGDLNFATISGSSPQMAAEQFKLLAKVDIEQIAYKGTSPALNDLVGGQVQAMFASLPPAVPHIQAGRLKAIAVTTKGRSSVLPNVPTMIEAGLPGFELEEWFAIAAPKDTPAPLIAKLNEAVRSALSDQAVRTRLINVGMDPVASSPEVFADLLKTETVKWGEIVRAAKMTPQ